MSKNGRFIFFCVLVTICYVSFKSCITGPGTAGIELEMDEWSWFARGLFLLAANFGVMATLSVTFMEDGQGVDWAWWAICWIIFIIGCVFYYYTQWGIVYLFNLAVWFLAACAGAIGSRR